MADIVAGQTGHIAEHNRLQKIATPLAVPLDTFAGSTDDSKLAAAMSYAAAQTVPPAISLAGRNHSFTGPVTLYNDFRLKGCNVERSSYNNSTCMAKVNCGAQNWLNVPSGTIQNFQIDNIFFWNTDNATVFMNGPGAIQYCGLHATSFAGFDCVIGSIDDHLGTTEISATGVCSFSQFKRTALALGGSDNISLFTDGCGVWTQIGANHVPQVSFSNLGKTTFGPVFMTVDSGIGGLELKNCDQFSLKDSIIEGLNTASPADGTLMTISNGSQVSVRGCSFGQGMFNPSVVPNDKALVTVDGSEASFFGNQFYLSPGQTAATVPVIEARNGATVYVYGTMRGTVNGGGTWGANHPIVLKDSTSTVVADASVQVVAE